MANSETIIDRQDASIRRMRDDVSDYGLVSKWLSDKRVLEFVNGRDNSYDLDRVRKKYEPRVRGEGPVVPCMMLYGGQPIGFMQFYRVLDGEEYEEKVGDPGLSGPDGSRQAVTTPRDSV